MPDGSGLRYVILHCIVGSPPHNLHVPYIFPLIPYINSIVQIIQIQIQILSYSTETEIKDSFKLLTASTSH